MIECIKWPQNPTEPPSPFLKAEVQRRIRITFHEQELIALPPKEQEALTALQDLSGLPEIDAFQTGIGNLPQLQISDLDDATDSIHVSGNGEEASISNAHQLRGIAAQLVNQADLNQPAAKNMLEDLITARAHHALNRDILITNSNRLIRNRMSPPVREANPCRPSEAAQLIGLFLRSRDNYSWSANRRLGRGLYYSILVHNRIPNLQRYRIECAKAGEVRNDDTSYLGQSVFDRCVRVLQARDAIGEQFYIPQSNETQATMMSHFDHLTLELNGVFDAQARVAHRAYRIDLSTQKRKGFNVWHAIRAAICRPPSLRRPDEWGVSFLDENFRKSLRLANAVQLAAMISESRVQYVLKILSILRNTIHGAGLQMTAYRREPESEKSYVQIPADYAGKLWRAAQNAGPREGWGLFQEHGETWLEPFTCSVQLVTECFDLVDKVCGATDLSGLFPSGQIPKISQPAPFEEEIKKRLVVLG